MPKQTHNGLAFEPIKKESGENPEQSRCCNSQHSTAEILNSHCEPVRLAGRLLVVAISQKTCHSEIFMANEVLALKNIGIVEQ